MNKKPTNVPYDSPTTGIISMDASTSVLTTSTASSTTEGLNTITVDYIWEN